MIKLRDDEECIPTKAGHQKFIKKLNQVSIYGAKCDLCYLCGNKCHEPVDEQFITDENIIEYVSGDEINRFVKINPEQTKIINGKKYRVDMYRPIIIKNKDVKYDVKTNALKTSLVTAPRVLYPTHRQYMGILVDDKACHCLKHQQNHISSIINNLVFISDRVDICRQCGHAHHSNPCHTPGSIIFSGAPYCHCTQCMCFNCLDQSLPHQVNCCGIVSRPSIDDFRSYIMKNAIPHKFLF